MKTELLWANLRQAKYLIKAELAWVILSRAELPDLRPICAELSLFCRISQIIDEVECNHCHQKVKIDQNYKPATGKFIILVYFKGLHHNDFAAYFTDKVGRAKEEANFEEINRLWLQYTASTRLEFKNSHNTKIKKAKAKKSNKKPK